MFSNLKKPYLIAELSGNHNGSINTAKKIIKEAKVNGADCVKLQTYSPNTMTIKSSKKDFIISKGLWKGYNLWDLYQYAHTPFEWHEELFNYAKKINITCISTPFDESAVDLLENLKVPFYKVASFEITDIPLIKYIAQKNKPIMLSTGMSNISEINQAVKTIKKYNQKEILLFHCVSGYPTPIEDINISNITYLRKKYKCEVGLSDHTIGNIAAITSIALGVKVIEKHFTLSRKVIGPDSEFSIEPNELKELKNNINDAFNALGSVNFRLKKSEKYNIKFRRSIYAIKDIKKNEKLTIDNIKRIRPGYGLEPIYYEKIIGKTLNRSIKKGSAIKKSYILNKVYNLKK
tara:strand:- start:934 stop:1977 length:1044 start_codon:yes stop_codon:yes gene_type:complete